MASVKGKNRMYKCPHCGEQTIGGFKKLMAGKATPVSCPHCGGKSYSDPKFALIGFVVMNLSGLAFAVPAVMLDAFWLLGGIFVAAFFSAKMFVLNRPMVKAVVGSNAD